MMELNLTRVDYTQVNITSPKSMRLLPASKKETNQIAIADHSGVLQVFNMKRGEVVSVFKTMPGPKITRLELGGPVDKPRDRIFVASGSDVRGFSRKGKQFLDFKTNLTEPVRSMYVEGTDLMLCGTYTFNHYRECKDLNYFLSSDTINDVICLPTNMVPEVICALACQDRVLKVLKDSDMLYEVGTAGPVQTLWLANNDGGAQGNEVVYGTTDGKIALVQLKKDVPVHKWELANDEQKGGVTSLACYDISNSGIDDLIVGRDDGLVEVYSFDEYGEPSLAYKFLCSESVTSVQGGVVSNPGYSEIVLSTYAGSLPVVNKNKDPLFSSVSQGTVLERLRNVANFYCNLNGWVIGLTSEHIQKGVSMTGEVIIDESVQNKIFQLKKEIEELQKRVKMERERYQMASKAENAVSAVPLFDVNDKFTLNKEDASYSLSIELQMSIDNILLQSDVPIDLLDVEKNSAVVSFSPCSPEEGNYMLTTYRCQANTTRLELKIRSIEGQAGSLLVYVTPRLHPKTCVVKQYPIKPLSLHQRSHSFDSNRPFNTLKLKGNFSLAEVHYWITALLPEVSDRPPAGDSVILYFASTFLDTQLECSYKRGEAEFRSDNISTISILKDTLTKEATKKKIQLDINYDINPESVKSALQRIHPMLDYQLTLAKKVQLIDGLKELQTGEGGDVNFLSPEYQDIINNADNLLKEFKKQPCHLERLYGMITDLYIDKFKFKGQNVKSRVPALLEVLDNYEFSKLLEFFELGT